MLKIYDLSVNGVLAPAFIPCDAPRFSWKLKSGREGVFQKSYSVTLSAGNEILWQSGEVLSERSVEIACPAALPPRTDLALSVAIEDNYGEKAEAALTFATALNPSDWKAKWIRPQRYLESWAPYLRTKFALFDKKIASARLYAAGLGCGEFTLNGKKISEDLIDPPMTNYEREVLYRVYDVKPYL